MADEAWLVEHEGRVYWAQHVAPAYPLTIEIGNTRADLATGQLRRVHADSVKRCKSGVTHSSAEEAPVPMWMYTELERRVTELADWLQQAQRSPRRPAT